MEHGCESVTRVRTDTRPGPGRFHGGRGPLSGLAEPHTLSPQRKVDQGILVSGPGDVLGVPSLLPACLCQGTRSVHAHWEDRDVALSLGQADRRFSIPSIPGCPRCEPLTSRKPSLQFIFRDSVPVPSRELAFQKVGSKQRTVLPPKMSLPRMRRRRGGTDLGSGWPCAGGPVLALGLVGAEGTHSLLLRFLVCGFDPGL